MVSAVVLACLLVSAVFVAGCSGFARKSTPAGNAARAARLAESIVRIIYEEGELDRLQVAGTETLEPAALSKARLKLYPNWRVLGATTDTDGYGETRYYCVVQLGRDDSRAVRAETIVLVRRTSEAGGSWVLMSDESTLFD